MGASGSKAAAAQKAASRAATAAVKPAETAATVGGGSGSAAAAAISAAERQREAALRARQQDPAALPAEQRVDNESLVQAMNKAMAGMRQYQFEVYRNPEVDKLYAVKKKSKEEREAELVGRLASPALKALMEEHARAVLAGRPPAVADLARRYGANPEVLQNFLQHNATPVMQTARDGRLVGSWPDGRDQ